MKNNPELPKFLDVLYLPEHEKIPGYLNISCVWEKITGWEKESGFTFQYLDQTVYFRVYPTGVQLPLGNAATVDEAIEIAKQFLKKWIGTDLADASFRHETAAAISRLEAIQRAEKEQRNREAAKNADPEMLERLQEMLRKAEEKKKGG